MLSGSNCVGKGVEFSSTRNHCGAFSVVAVEELLNASASITIKLLLLMATPELITVSFKDATLFSTFASSSKFSCTDTLNLPLCVAIVVKAKVADSPCSMGGTVQSRSHCWSEYRYL